MAKTIKAAPENRTNILRIRLTDAERKSLDQAAQDRSLDTSTWARMELVTLAKGKR